MSLAPLIAARTCACHTKWLALVSFFEGWMRRELLVVDDEFDDVFTMALITMKEQR
jgi:hypothetical protein